MMLELSDGRRVKVFLLIFVILVVGGMMLEACGGGTEPPDVSSIPSAAAFSPSPSPSPFLFPSSLSPIHWGDTVDGGVDKQRGYIFLRGETSSSSTAVVFIVDHSQSFQACDASVKEEEAALLPTLVETASHWGGELWWGKLAEDNLEIEPVIDVRDVRDYVLHGPYYEASGTQSWNTLQDRLKEEIPGFAHYIVFVFTDGEFAQDREMPRNLSSSVRWYPVIFTGCSPVESEQWEHTIEFWEHWFESIPANPQGVVIGDVAARPWKRLRDKLEQDLWRKVHAQLWYEAFKLLIEQKAFPGIAMLVPSSKNKNDNVSAVHQIVITTTDGEKAYGYGIYTPQGKSARIVRFSSDLSPVRGTLYRGKGSSLEEVEPSSEVGFLSLCEGTPAYWVWVPAKQSMTSPDTMTVLLQVLERAPIVGLSPNAISFDSLESNGGWIPGGHLHIQWKIENSEGKTTQDIVGDEAYAPCYHLRVSWQGDAHSLILEDWELGPDGELGPNVPDRRIGGNVLTLSMADWQNTLPWGKGVLQVCLMKGKNVVKCSHLIEISRPCLQKDFPWALTSTTKDGERIQIKFPTKEILDALRSKKGVWPQSVTRVSSSLIVGYPKERFTLDQENSGATVYTLAGEGRTFTCDGQLIQVRDLSEKYWWFRVSPTKQEENRLILSEDGAGTGCISHVGAMALQVTIEARFKSRDGNRILCPCQVIHQLWEGHQP